MTGCPFCMRIARGEFSHHDDWCVAFEPLSPAVEGHLLVVPRRHVSSALESPLHAGRALEFAASLAGSTGLAAANFITSAGSVATQSVFHLHVHIVPRGPGDGLPVSWPWARR